LFKSIAGRINTSAIRTVPGENDAALDGGVLYREHFGESHYSFDHKGVHFVALDNVSRGHPEVGPDQLAWLKTDVARFPKTAPLVVFTHRPLFDLKPEWEWFTADGDDVMNVLAPYENVTVLYGHIHRHHFQQSGKVKHYAARSLIFACYERGEEAASVQQGRSVQGAGHQACQLARPRRCGHAARGQRCGSGQGRVLRPVGNATDDQGQQFN
jgi:hypothetical protein